MKVERISLLVPTRGRRDRFLEFYRSVYDTAKYPANVDVIAYTDEDDNSYDGLNLYNATIIQGPRISIAEAWNECWRRAEGDYLGLFGDDVIFRTEDWDELVLRRFEPYEDKIAYVFGYDGSPYGVTFGTHGFIHQNWAQAVGRFVAPYFKANYVDKWLNDVAIDVGRHCHVDAMFEHMHQGFGKAPDDETYRNGRANDAGMADLYESKLDERKAEAELLRSLLQ